MAVFRERETPKSRVYAYIKDPPFPTGTPQRKLVELLGFRSVNSTVSRTGNGQATLVFSNYKSCLIRYVRGTDIKTAETANSGAETTNEYAKLFMATITSKNQSGRIFEGLWNDVILADGAQKLVNITGGSKFIDYSRSRGDVVDKADRNAMSRVNSEGFIATLPFLNYFDPIFVDYLGQDGFWYAGFTGLVTRISENYNKTGDQSITINCRDLSVLFDNISLVSAWNRISVPEQNSNLKNFIYSTEANIEASTSPLANIFSGFKSVGAIISEVVKRAQDMWRYEDNGEQKFSGDIGVRAFKFDTHIYPYEGISGRRGSIQRKKFEMPEDLSPEDFLDFNDNELTKKHYLCDDEAGTLPPTDAGGRPVIRGSKKIFVDPLILKFDNKFIHKLLNNGLSLYKDSLASADQILNDLVAKMYAYKYFDGNGNLIIELARPNAFPNLLDYGGRSTATVIKHKVPVEQAKKGGTRPKKERVLKNETLQKFVDRVNANLSPKITVNDLISLNGGRDNAAIFGTTKKKSGVEVLWLREGALAVVGTEPESTGTLQDIQSLSVYPEKTETAPGSSEFPDDIISWTTLLYHGKNYVLSPDDFNAFTSAMDEAALMTVVQTSGLFPFLPQISQGVSNSTVSLTGVAVADFDKLAKLGVRRYQVQTMYNVVWPSREAGSRILSYQSAAVLERINAMADTGTLLLNHRPDLQLGRTLINPLRMKSYIIEGVTNSWSPGAPHSTTLTLGYGHPVHKTLEVPWLAIFNEPKLFFGAEGRNALEKIQALDADGIPISDTEELQYKNPAPQIIPGDQAAA